jgi:rubredoxin
MREKIDRNKLIWEKIKKGEYQIDIAKEFDISQAMICKIKKRMTQIEEEMDAEKYVNVQMLKAKITDHCYKVYRNALKNKKIKKSFICEVCGSKKNTHGHHKNYRYPLKVNWLCPSCHSKETSKKRAELLKEKV